MTKVIEVVDSEEDFEVFDRSSPIESSHASFSDLPLAQVSSNQEPSDVPEVMVLQRKNNTSLLELLKSHAGRSTPEVAVQSCLSTPFSTHTSHFESTNKKRMRDKKGKDMSEVGEVVPSKEFEPQKGQKLQKGHKRSPQPRV